MEPDEPTPYRFATAEQVAHFARASRQRFPVFIVPLPSANNARGPWQFVTPRGNVPAPRYSHEKEVVADFESMLKYADGQYGNGLCWRFVPESDGRLVCFAPCPGDGDCTEAIAAFEKWLMENDYPFDRLDTLPPL